MSNENKNLWQCELYGNEPVFSVGSLYTLSCEDASGQGLSGGDVEADLDADTLPQKNDPSSSDPLVDTLPSESDTSSSDPLADEPSSTTDSPGLAPQKFEQQPHIIFNEDHLAYSLVILKQSLNTAHKAEFIVTSYQPDAYENISFKVTDGFTQFQVEGLSWQVKSVIPPNKQVQPYGPMGPFAMAWPGWLWPSVVLMVAAGLTAFAYWLYRCHKWRVWMNKIKLPPTNLSPSNQFYKDLRQALNKHDLSKQNLNRQNLNEQNVSQQDLGQQNLNQQDLSRQNLNRQGLNRPDLSEESLNRTDLSRSEAPYQKAPCLAKSLDGVLRLYLVRRYQIPAVYQSEKQILKSLKKQVPRDKLSLLKHLLKQLQKLQAEPDVQSQHQLAKMLRTWVSEVDGGDTR